MKRKGRGNDWDKELVYSCRQCGKGNLCDVCHEHQEPRGECEKCPIGPVGKPMDDSFAEDAK